MHSGSLPQLMSDHLPVYAVKKKPKEDFVIVHTMGRSYRTYDYTDFCDYLYNINWSTWQENKNVDEKWDTMLGYIVSGHTLPHKEYAVQGHAKTLDH